MLALNTLKEAMLVSLRLLQKDYPELKDVIKTMAKVVVDYKGDEEELPHDAMKRIITNMTNAARPYAVARVNKPESKEFSQKVTWLLSAFPALYADVATHFQFDTVPVEDKELAPRHPAPELPLEKWHGLFAYLTKDDCARYARVSRTAYAYVASYLSLHEYQTLPLESRPYALKAGLFLKPNVTSIDGAGSLVITLSNGDIVTGKGNLLQVWRKGREGYSIYATETFPEGAEVTALAAFNDGGFVSAYAIGEKLKRRGVIQVWTRVDSDYANSFSYTTKRFAPIFWLATLPNNDFAFVSGEKVSLSAHISENRYQEPVIVADEKYCTSLGVIGSPDGALIVKLRNQLKVYTKSSSGRYVERVHLPEHSPQQIDDLMSAFMLPNGDIVGVGDWELYIWRKVAEESYELHQKIPVSDSFSPDTYNIHKDLLISANCLPDGKIVTTSSDKTVKIWGLNANGYYEYLQTLVGHNATVVAAAQLLHNQLVSLDKNGTLKLWSFPLTMRINKEIDAPLAEARALLKAYCQQGWSPLIISNYVYPELNEVNQTLQRATTVGEILSQLRAITNASRSLSGLIKRVEEIIPMVLPPSRVEERPATNSELFHQTPRML